MEHPEPRPPRLPAECTLPLSVTAPAQARRWIADILDWENLAALVPTAELLTSEIVTNAYAHAHSGCTVRVEDGEGRVRITVTDAGKHVPIALADPSLLPRGGRGLRIVDDLATRWGTHTVTKGNAVWFELSTLNHA
jgi:anti-sigma regulatory factor (Ser/Thr protein kinase)